MPTNIDNISIRRAKSEDAPFLAEIILVSGRAHVERGIWEVILNESEQEVLKFLEQITTTDPPHLFHHSCFMIAEADNKQIAGLGGYDPRVKGYDKLQIAIDQVQLKRGYTSKAQNVVKRAQKILPCVPENIQGTWVIDSVATMPDYRRKGVSEKLIRAIMENGRIQGYEKSQVNIYIGNVPALRAYEKMGYSIHEEKRCPAFMEEIGSPGMASMVADL